MILFNSKLFEEEEEKRINIGIKLPIPMILY